MRVVATADLHGNLPQIPPCDLLIIAGDVCPHWNHDVEFQRRWLHDVFSPWLERQPAKCLVGVAGNHDLALFEDDNFGHELPWHYLRDSGTTCGGKAIWGIPWTRGTPDHRWKFHKTEGNLAPHRFLVPENTDILVVHGPPYGTLDLTSPAYFSSHVGTKHWMRLINDVKPELYVCGHIHTGYGIEGIQHDTGEVTTVVNAAFCDDPPLYAAVQTPITLDLGGPHA